MWYLLVVMTLTGELAPEDVWSRNHTFQTLEACAAVRSRYQREINSSWLQDGGKKERHVTFTCLRGPEILA